MRVGMVKEPKDSLDKFPEYDPKTNLVYIPKP